MHALNILENAKDVTTLPNEEMKRQLDGWDLPNLKIFLHAKKLGKLPSEVKLS